MEAHFLPYFVQSLLNLKGLGFVIVGAVDLSNCWKPKKKIPIGIPIVVTASRDRVESAKALPLTLTKHIQAIDPTFTILDSYEW